MTSIEIISNMYCNCSNEFKDKSLSLGHETGHVIILFRATAGKEIMPCVL